MRALPKALSRWEAELAFLPDPLALALGGMLPKLAMLVGPLTRSTTKTGEPDGYAQLSRRGPLDRLLLTQWAMLDAMPEEFVRRAASNELLFHELARKEPKTSQQSIALFDMGPMLLGAPRLAELALLIVLARRAADAGVPFHWGVLGDAEVHAYQGESSLRALLDARTATLPHLEPKGPAAGAEADDVWLIGHETSLPWRELAASSHVLLDEVIDLGVANAETLSVVVRRAGKEATRALSLKLPSPETCTAILRAPASEKVRVPHVAKATSVDVPKGGYALIEGTELQFSRDGGKLLARTQDGHIAVFTLPNTETELPKRPYIARRPASCELIACGTAGRRVVLVVRMKGELYVRGLRGGPADHLDKLFADERAVALEPHQLRPCYVGVSRPIERIPDVCFEPNQGELVWTSGSPDGSRQHFSMISALPSALNPSGMVILESEPSLPGFARVTRQPSRTDSASTSTSIPGPGPVVVGGSLRGEAMVASAMGDRAHVLHAITGETTSIPIEKNHKLVGVTTFRSKLNTPFAIVTSTPRELRVRSAQVECQRIHFDDELVRVVCSPRGPQAVVMMMNGTIEVVSLLDGRRLLRIQAPPIQKELP